MRILLIEDDVVMGATLKVHLMEKGYGVDWFIQIEDAYKRAHGTNYDLIIMDFKFLSLPEETPVEAVERFRLIYRDPCMAILYDPKVRSRQLKKVMGYVELCIPKPFKAYLIDQEISDLLSKPRQRRAPLLQIGRLLYDAQSQSLFYKGRRIKLSRREQTVFDILVKNANQVVPKEDIGKALAMWEDEMNPTVVEVYVYRLRRRLSGTGTSIQTLRGFGYLLETEIVLDY